MRKLMVGGRRGALPIFLIDVKARHDKMVELVEALEPLAVSR